MRLLVWRPDDAESAARDVGEARVEGLEVAALHVEDAKGRVVHNGRGREYGLEELGLEAKSQRPSRVQMYVRAERVTDTVGHLVEKCARLVIADTCVDGLASRGERRLKRRIRQRGGGVEALQEELGEGGRVRQDAGGAEAVVDRRRCE